MNHSLSNSLKNPIAVCIILFIGIFLLRSIYTAPPEIHDAKKKWVIANELAESADFRILLESDHHSSRWAVILPTALAIKISGQNYVTYFCLTLLLFSAVFVCFVSVARDEFSPGLLILFSVLLFFEPMFFRASSQLQPFVFGVFYLTLSLWMLSRFFACKNVWYLCLSALLTFLAYGTKETYLLFAAGLVLLLVIKAGVKPTFTFCAILLVLLTGETLVFNYLSGELTYGRIEFLSEGKHLEKMPGRVRYEFPEFLTRRWLLLTPFDQFVSMVSGICLVSLLISGRWRRLNLQTLGILLMGGCYAILVTIFPLSIDPFIPIQPLKVKYLTPLMPFFIFTFVVALKLILETLKPSFRSSLERILAGTAVIFAVYCVAIDSPFRYEFREVRYPEKTAMLWTGHKFDDFFDQGYGHCDRNFNDILRAQNMIRNYFNQNILTNRLLISSKSGFRVLHDMNIEPHSIEKYSAHPFYFKLIDKESCRKS